MPPPQPKVADDVAVLPPNRPLAERVLAAFRAAAPLALNVTRLSELLAVKETATRSAIMRLNFKGHKITSLRNKLFVLED